MTEDSQIVLETIPTPPRSVAVRGIRLAGLVVAIAAAAALVCAGLGASMARGRATAHWRPLEVADSEGPQRLAPILALLDSLVTSLGATSPLDSERLAQLVSLTKMSGAEAGWIDAPQVSASDSGNVTLFRAWARSSPLPPFWGYRAGFAGVDVTQRLPARQLLAFKGLWTANVTLADSAWSRGNADSAIVRALETIAGSRHLLQQPLPMDAVIGRMMLVDGARVLQRVSGRDHALHDAADRLVEMLRVTRVAPTGAAPAAIAARRGVLSEDLAAVARNRTLLPAHRLQAVERAMVGACLSAREVLLGPTSARRAKVDSLLESMRDIARMDELRAVYQRTLDAFDDGPIVQLTLTGVSGPGAFLSRLLIPSVVDRTIFCRGVT